VLNRWRGCAGVAGPSLPALEPVGRSPVGPAGLHRGILLKVGLQIGCHRRRVERSLRIEAQLLLALAPQRHHQIAAAAGQRCEHRLGLVAGVGQGLLGQGAKVVLHRLQHPGQFAGVAAAVGQLHGHDDVRLIVHRRLRVVAGIQAPAGALHDAAVRVGEVVLRLVLWHAKLALVAPAARRLVGISAALAVGIALTLLQALTGLGDDRQPGLAPCDLGRDVPLGFVLLGFISLQRTLEQGIDLRLQLRLGLEHVAVAHRLVAAGVGLELGAVHRDGAQLDQTHLTRQTHHLHEQVAQLLGVERAKVPQGAMRREVARGQHPEGNVFVQLPWQSCAS